MSIFDGFERKHEYLICVDSDGCVMDTIKAMIETYNKKVEFVDFDSLTAIVNDI